MICSYKEAAKDLTEAESKCSKNGNCNYVLETQDVRYGRCHTAWGLCEDTPVEKHFEYCSIDPVIYKKLYTLRE